MKKFKVLVADDNPFFQKIIDQQLSREGYEVWTATDGHDAIKIASLLRPDLVIADEFMPRMTGIELCSRLRPPFGADHNPFTIVATANPESPDPFHAADFGVDLYMSKNDLMYLIDNKLLRAECLPKTRREVLDPDMGEFPELLNENLAEPIKVAC